MVGGIVKFIVDKKKNVSEKEKKDADANGILFSSGLIAGEGLVGILLAILTIIPVSDSNVGDIIGSALPGMMPILTNANFGNIVGLVAFALLTLSLWSFCYRNVKKAK